MLFFFPRGVLDEILNLIESVSEGFPSYFYRADAISIDDVLHQSAWNIYSSTRADLVHFRKPSTVSRAAYVLTEVPPYRDNLQPLHSFPLYLKDIQLVLLFSSPTRLWIVIWPLKIKRHALNGIYPSPP